MNPSISFKYTHFRMYHVLCWSCHHFCTWLDQPVIIRTHSAACEIGLYITAWPMTRLFFFFKSTLQHGCGHHSSLISHSCPASFWHCLFSVAAWLLIILFKLRPSYRCTCIFKYTVCIYIFFICVSLSVRMSVRFYGCLGTRIIH